MSANPSTARHRPRHRAVVCSHFHAQAIGTTEARMLADGTWVYRRTYECPDCGARFTEQQPQQF